MTYVFGPPSTATPAEKRLLGIVWCLKCECEVLDHRGSYGWCDTPIQTTRKEAA